MFPLGTKDQNKSDIVCYIKDTSPIKKKGTLKYFNCILQTTSSGVQKAVCFNPERKAAFDTLEKQRSPVKLSKYATSNKYGTTDIVIQKYTNVVPTEAPELEALYQQQTSSYATISSLQDVAPNQLITVKAKLLQLSATKNVIMHDSKPVKKQEGIIVDTTSYMKIVLWAQYTGNLQESNTYIFTNLRLKQSNGLKYLNTPKDHSGVSIEETEDFTDPLYPMDGIELLVSKEACVSLIGVQSTTKSHICSSCTRKIIVRPNGKLGYCEHCKLTQKLSANFTQWSVKLHLQEKEGDKQILRLFAYNQIVQQLAMLCEIPPCLKSCSEEELNDALLMLDEIIISYDSQQRKITEVKLPAVE